MSSDLGVSQCYLGALFKKKLCINLEKKRGISHFNVLHKENSSSWNGTIDMVFVGGNKFPVSNYTFSGRECLIPQIPSAQQTDLTRLGVITIKDLVRLGEKTKVHVSNPNQPSCHVPQTADRLISIFNGIMNVYLHWE